MSLSRSFSTVLVVAICLTLATVATAIVEPKMEDFDCFICQYALQRVQAGRAQLDSAGASTGFVAVDSSLERTSSPPKHHNRHHRLSKSSHHASLMETRAQAKAGFNPDQIVYRSVLRGETGGINPHVGRYVPVSLETPQERLQNTQQELQLFGLLSSVCQEEMPTHHFFRTCRSLMKQFGPIMFELGNGARPDEVCLKTKNEAAGSSQGNSNFCSSTGYLAKQSHIVASGLPSN